MIAFDNKKIVMVLAGGTGTAWHICETIRKYFDDIYLIVCDINPKHLVHSAIFADKFMKILPIADSHYETFMYQVFDKYHVDILIPLIDYDINIFSADNDKLLYRNIFSTAPRRSVFATLANKKNMHNFLNHIGIATPDIYNNIDCLDATKEYIIKESIGYGSRSIKRAKGENILQIEDGKIIQDICFSPEITVDAINNNGDIYALCRERLEVKAGVCTKARVFFDKKIIDILKTISKNIELPTVFCVQFMKDENDNWSLTDFNLRAGAGTAMSDIVKFQVVRAALSIWLKKTDNIDIYLKYQSINRYVVRTYREIITK
jgi:hypothetical protein